MKHDLERSEETLRCHNKILRIELDFQLAKNGREYFYPLTLIERFNLVWIIKIHLDVIPYVF
ncbi:hypothetical protein MSWAN_1035 [Methanobacterium paludis]|uniref:Uncharacterized protein n=1 Tax=Methanobacterium paludis (strain DSM 25820 / JCM 18151 / SWAN1) TaxID=868131 RepID=F6D3R2_METPW|nr:hypothetical protein MSWAN_1035 [Methanobacterium paludis]